MSTAASNNIFASSYASQYPCFNCVSSFSTNQKTLAGTYVCPACAHSLVNVNKLMLSCHKQILNFYFTVSLKLPQPTFGNLTEADVDSIDCLSCKQPVILFAHYPPRTTPSYGGVAPVTNAPIPTSYVPNLRSNLILDDDLYAHLDIPEHAANSCLKCNVELCEALDKYWGHADDPARSIALRAATKVMLLRMSRLMMNSNSKGSLFLNLVDNKLYCVIGTEKSYVMLEFRTYYSNGTDSACFFGTTLPLADHFVYIGRL